MASQSGRQGANHLDEYRAGSFSEEVDDVTGDGGRGKVHSNQRDLYPHPNTERDRDPNRNTLTRFVSARKRLLWAAFLVLHLTLAINIALLDMSSGMVESGRDAAFWRRIATATTTILRTDRPKGDWLRELTTAYSECASINSGYSYFAPDVPPNAKLVFEIHRANGKVTHDLPVVEGSAAGYRIATLLEWLSKVRYRPLRLALLKILAESAAREHPDAVTIRALLGVAIQPGLADYIKGKRTFYRRIEVYEFHPLKAGADPNKR